MLFTKREEKTIRYYNKHAREWAEERNPKHKSFWDGDVKRFNELISKGKIIEIGSGSGREANRLIALGYDYLGTDVSKGLLRVAKENNPNGKFLLKNDYDLDFLPESFDGFWSSATLLHVPKSRIRRVLKNIKRILKHVAIGFISLKENKSESESIEEKTGRYFLYYKIDEFKAILKNVDFEIIEANQKKQTKENDDVVYWLTFFVKKT